MRTINISIMPNPFCMWEKHYNEFDSKMIADEFNVAWSKWILLFVLIQEKLKEI